MPCPVFLSANIWFINEIRKYFTKSQKKMLFCVRVSTKLLKFAHY